MTKEIKQYISKIIAEINQKISELDAKLSDINEKINIVNNNDIFILRSIIALIVNEFAVHDKVVVPLTSSDFIYDSIKIDIINDNLVLTIIKGKNVPHNNWN